MHLSNTQIQWMMFMNKQFYKILIIFDDIIANIMANKRFQAIIKELFIRCRKLNISLVFITKSYFSVPKGVRLNSTHYLIVKINNKKELWNTGDNHSTNFNYQDFMKICRECTREPSNIFDNRYYITRQWSFKI